MLISVGLRLASSVACTDTSTIIDFRTASFELDRKAFTGESKIMTET